MCTCLRAISSSSQCIGNGLDVSDVLQNGGKKTKKLEMFFFGIPRLCSLQHFPNLRVLRIVNQSVENIEGLSGCPLLEELWLAECRIQVGEGCSSQGCLAPAEGLTLETEYACACVHEFSCDAFSPCKPHSLLGWC